MLRPETRARARCLQLLYAWDVHDRPPLGDILGRLADLDGDTVRWGRGGELARRVISAIERLDADIAQIAENWRLDRIGAIERNILRLGALELHGKTTPPAVVIDEAVRLAHWFAGSKAPAFVNGVLDALARRLGRL